MFVRLRGSGTMIIECAFVWLDPQPLVDGHQCHRVPFACQHQGTACVFVLQPFTSWSGAEQVRDLWGFLWLWQLPLLGSPEMGEVFTPVLEKSEHFNTLRRREAGTNNSSFSYLTELLKIPRDGLDSAGIFPLSFEFCECGLLQHGQRCQKVEVPVMRSDGVMWDAAIKLLQEWDVIF